MSLVGNCESIGVCSGGTMTLSKCWSLREGRGNGPSKPIGLDGPLFSGKMTVTGETNLSL